MKTAIPIERIFETTLASYEGALYEEHITKGVSKWIMPIGRFSRTRTLHGQQFCAACLQEDEEPYFRRRWRIALFVVCEKHRILLRDFCPRCSSPVSFHEGDFGRRVLAPHCPIVFCVRCGWDFRAELDADIRVDDSIAHFQDRVSMAIREGWTEFGRGRAIHSVLFFNGVHWLLRVLASNSDTGRVRDWLLMRNGRLPLPTAFRHSGHRFQDLRVGDRFALITLLVELLDRWPEALLTACRTARVSSSYLRDYKDALPYWLESEIVWALDDRHYIPTDEERAAVIAFLRSRNESTSVNNVNRWLGAWYVLRNKSKDSPSASLRRHAGKPRGPRKSGQATSASWAPSLRSYMIK